MKGDGYVIFFSIILERDRCCLLIRVDDVNVFFCSLVFNFLVILFGYEFFLNVKNKVLKNSNSIVIMLFWETFRV